MAVKKVRRGTAATAPTSLADKLNAGAAIVQEEEEVIVEEATVVPDEVVTTAPLTEDIVPAVVEVVAVVSTRPWMDTDQKPKDGVIVGPGEPVSANGVVNGTQVILSERVYRAHLLPRSKRWGFLLLYPKGHRIALSKLTTVNGDTVVDGKITLAEKLSNGDTIVMPTNLAA